MCPVWIIFIFIHSFAWKRQFNFTEVPLICWLKHWINIYLRYWLKSFYFYVILKDSTGGGPLSCEGQGGLIWRGGAHMPLYTLIPKYVLNPIIMLNGLRVLSIILYYQPCNQNISRMNHNYFLFADELERSKKLRYHSERAQKLHCNSDTKLILGFRHSGFLIGNLYTRS